MSSTWKNNIEITIFGESHGKAIGIVLGNLPSGIKIDFDAVAKEMKRRAPGQDKMSTSRKEADQVEIISGIQDGITTGAPLCGMIYNSDQHSKDYSLLKEKMRPGHSDYPAFVKYKGFNDVRGGGHFSGRITAPIVFAGAIAKQILMQKGIYIGAHILSIKNIYDENFDQRLSLDTLNYLSKQHYPVINQEIYDQFVETVDQARMNLDSVGGKIECAIVGLEPGLGEPFFDSIESHLSSLLFSIPAVKSVAFGNDKISELYGSEANDCYYYDKEGKVKTTSNNNGGITGGISNGMPIVFTVGIKPTPSIGKEQKTIDVKHQENTTLAIKGRHDPCIVFRATVVVEAMAALAMLDLVR
ncbi:chorismate synthase [uncultured Thomasclavelia sp.]|uniref:chorismate synthase n=1 Tax=uncultured Thomasclavelia sp. TaxID=3025759 RepID=UPI00280BB5DF|nr:chorismate synthase [uncultured Thomasclavelia sp.]